MTERSFPGSRLRRLRRHGFLRELVRETTLTPGDFIYPVFVLDGAGRREPVASMPGVERLSVDLLVQHARDAVALGIPAIALFPVIEPGLKSETAAEPGKPTAPCRAPWRR